MTSRTPITLEEQLETAAQLAARARVFFDLWWFYRSEDTRSSNLDKLKDYGQFFIFDEHAHLVAFVIHITGLYDRRKDTISLIRLCDSREMRERNQGKLNEVKALILEASPVLEKAKVLRDYLFAHRSQTLGYAEAFRQADVTPNQLRELTETTLKIANKLLVIAGMKTHIFSIYPLSDLRSLIRDMPNRTTWSES